MTTARALACLGIIIGIFASPVLGDESVTRQDAVVALRRAVNFYRGEVASHGGYVFRVSSELKLREGAGKVGDSILDAFGRNPQAP